MTKIIIIRAAAAAALAGCLAAAAGCGLGKPADVDLRGQIAIAGQGSLPKGTTARISLIQHETDNTDDRIVAERTLRNIGKLPVDFDLSVDRQLLSADGHYAMNAQIMDKAGNVRWETRVPQAVVPTNNRAVTLVLQTRSPHATDDFQRYRCADDFGFDMSRNDRQATLHMGKRQISLEARPLGAAQGAVYADEHGDQLTFGHDKTTLAIDGTTHIDCAASKAAGRSRQTAEN